MGLCKMSERKSQNLGVVPERQRVRRRWGNNKKEDVIKCGKIMAMQGMIDLGVPLFPALVMGEKKAVKAESFQFKTERGTIFTP